MSRLLLPLFFVILSCYHVTCKQDEAEITFNILQQGQQIIDFGNEFDLIILIGISGSGKSTLVHLLAGDNDKLHGVEELGNNFFRDERDKIGESIDSKTLVPEMTKDPLTGAAFIDCPGFYDTRNISLDIAGGYFVKQVLNKAKRVKFIMTLSYSAVISGGDRQGLTHLLSHVVTLINDVHKFRDGITLIVTKVNNKLLPDEEIEGFIKAFLVNAKNTLRKRKPLGEKILITKNMIELVDILLENTNRTKIGIFRTPDFIAPVSESQDFQDQRTKLRDIILRQTQFTDIAESDTNYKISLESKQYINETLLSIVDDKIKSEMSKVSQKILNTYKIFGNSSKDLISFRQKVVDDKVKFMNLNKANVITFIHEFSSFLQSQQNMTSDVLYNFNLLLKYSIAFREINSDTSDNFEQHWLEPLILVETYLNELSKWYSFITDFYNEIPNYDVQKNKHKHLNLVQDFPSITKLNLQNFLLLIVHLPLKNTNIMELIVNTNFSNIDDFTLRHINQVVKVSCREKTSINSRGDVFFNAYFATLSEVKSEYEVVIGLNVVKSITIYIVDTLFLDADLNFTGKQIDLYIFAKTWKVIEWNRYITLDGKNAEMYEVDTALYGRKPGQNGKDGKPGKNGQSAGNFYGIGFDITGSLNLKITANGGNGANGQNGGDGFSGKIGDEIEFVKMPGEFHEMSSYESKLKAKNIQFNSRSHSVTSHTWKYLNNASFNFKLLGEEGSSGGAGGHGGHYGNAGSAGNVIIKLCYNTSEIETIACNGTNGNPGNGGQGGAAGFKRIIEVECHKLDVNCFLFCSKIDKFSCIQKSKSKIYYQDGDNGTDNYNTLKNDNTLTETSNNSHNLFERKIYQFAQYVSREMNSMVNPQYYEEFLTYLYLNDSMLVNANP